MKNGNLILVCNLVIGGVKKATRLMVYNKVSAVDSADLSPCTAMLVCHVLQYNRYSGEH